MIARPCYSPELRAISEARMFADLTAAATDDAQFYAMYRARALRLIAALVRVPFLLDAAAVAAFGQIPAADYPPDYQMDWDAETDTRARLLANVLRIVAFSRLTVDGIADALEADRLTVAAAVEQLHASGLVYPNARHEICLSPLGEPAARDLEDNNDAIRPHQMTRRLNRREH